MSLLRKGAFGGLIVLLAGGAVILSYLRLYRGGAADLPAAGPVATVTRSLGPFGSLVIDGPFAVTLASGTPGLTLTAETTVADAVTPDLRNGVLRLYLKDPVEAGAPPRVAITAPALGEIELVGTARLETAGGLGPSVRIVAHDAATAVLRGACVHAVLIADGAADIDARGLRCPSLETTAAGSALIRKSGA